MSRSIVVGACVIAAIVVAWLLLRADEPVGDAPRTGAGAEQRFDPARPGEGAEGGAAGKAGELAAGGSAAASADEGSGSEAESARAGAAASGTPGNVRPFAETGGAGVEGVARETIAGAAGGPARAAPDAAGDEGNPTDPESDTEGESGEAADPDPDAAGTPGRMLSEQEARERAEAQIPDDGSIAPEQREELVEDLMREILDKSEQAAGWIKPSPTP